jgi:CRISPR-associated protein Cas2
LHLEELAMKVLVAYDVSTVDSAGARRLRRVARACQDFGQRVQKSVFECVVSPADWLQLRERLFKEFDSKKDSLRFYFLTGDVVVEHHGAQAPTDLQGLLVV